jgi:hypothetical protein
MVPTRMRFDRFWIRPSSVLEAAVVSCFGRKSRILGDRNAARVSRGYGRRFGWPLSPDPLMILVVAVWLNGEMPSDLGR